MEEEGIALDQGQHLSGGHLLRPRVPHQMIGGGGAAAAEKEAGKQAKKQWSHGSPH
jgi:hypothetical protein